MKQKYLFTAVAFYFMHLCLLSLFMEKGIQFGLENISNRISLSEGYEKTVSIE
jgi:hypothetical protein